MVLSVFTSIFILLAMMLIGSSHGFSVPDRQRSQQLSMSSSSLMGPTTTTTTTGTSSAGTNVGKSFERRMRDLLGKRRKNEQESQTATTTKNSKHIKVVTSLEQYKQIVGEERQRIVCVRFSAPWCKACKAVEPNFVRLANEFSKKHHQKQQQQHVSKNDNDVVFVEVPVTDSASSQLIHQGLGVPSLPYVHIYTPQGGLVEELKLNKPAFRELTNKLQRIIDNDAITAVISTTKS
eukprot:CAMPEP_0202456488 /NCGR_PEP_ID=MMETSP1360-20130828/13729_1 /ASSEMBLY_ACC=CAM_ASM_000848 /TAXON_ID=515479 /ORGANISM="Licmophora paradoxa, Strain CCMP2313" /LENGTH=235 /DNA_ID=CAMNT_0049076301 /DNA_START=110 /DNA_END=817 /DNA_ORIENTATION=+